MVCFTKEIIRPILIGASPSWSIPITLGHLAATAVDLCDLEFSEMYSSPLITILFKVARYLKAGCWIKATVHFMQVRNFCITKIFLLKRRK